MRVYTAPPVPARRRSGRPLNTSSLGRTYRPLKVRPIGDSATVPPSPLSPRYHASMQFTARDHSSLPPRHLLFWCSALLLTTAAGCQPLLSARIAEGGEEYDHVWFQDEEDAFLLQFGTHLQQPRIRIVDQDSVIVSPNGVRYDIATEPLPFDIGQPDDSTFGTNVRTLIRRVSDDGEVVDKAWELGTWRFELATVTPSMERGRLDLQIELMEDGLSPAGSALQTGRLPRDG